MNDTDGLSRANCFISSNEFVSIDGVKSTVVGTSRSMASRSDIPRSGMTNG